MNNKKTYFIIFLVVFALCLFGFVWSIIVTKDMQKDGKMANTGQSVVVNSLSLVESKDGKKYWELYAKKGEYTGENNKVKLEDILGNFYNKEEEVVLSFKAEEGNYDDEKKSVTLKGDVLAVSKDGSMIRADVVIWQGQDEDIIAVGNVRINRNNELLTESRKAVFNSELTYFKIEGKSESHVFEKEKDI